MSKTIEEILAPRPEARLRTRSRDKRLRTRST